jgi:hypothetical protein
VVDTAYDDGVAAMQNERDLAVKLAEEEKARAEEEKARAEEADRRAAEEKARAEEADRRAAVEKARAEALFAELEKLKQGKS